MYMYRKDKRRAFGASIQTSWFSSCEACWRLAFVPPLEHSKRKAFPSDFSNNLLTFRHDTFRLDRNSWSLLTVSVSQEIQNSRFEVGVFDAGGTLLKISIPTDVVLLNSSPLEVHMYTAERWRGDGIE